MGNTDLQNLTQRLNDPGREFTPVPLWFWNDRLDDAKIKEQIISFYDKGIYAFMIHPRMGIPEDIPYMSDIYLDHVEKAVETAAILGMRVCLYDEGMYPSGSAHGQVVAENPRHAAQALVMRYKEDGSVIFVQTRSGGTIRGIHFGEDGFEPGAPPAADIMDPDAVRSFIRLTHDKYYSRLSGYFGSTIYAIFTDEPSLTGRGDMTGKIPWTNGMHELCHERGITDDDLHHLFESGDDDVNTGDDGRGRKVRRIFAEVCAERLERSFYKQLSDWCTEHGIALTGHPSQSDDIGLLRSFHIPGQDLVLRKVGPENGKALSGRDSTLAKCSADSARHSGKRRNSCECFGCCVRSEPSKGWDLPPEDMKWYIDWLAVRGVNLFMPHAFYYSLDGRRAYERPPDVGPAQTWWEHYRYWSDYMTRLSALMSDGMTMTHTAVLCLSDHLPFLIASHLYMNQIDFNYLEEYFLTSDINIGRVGHICASRYSYDTILVEDPSVFSEKTLHRLHELSGYGIRVIYGCDPGEDLIHDLRKNAPVEVSGYLPDLRMTCQQKEDHVAVLLVNEGEDELVFTLKSSLPGIPLLWDPWNGTFGSACCRVAESGDSVIVIDVRLKFRESAVLIFDGKKIVSGSIAGLSAVCANRKNIKDDVILELDHGWDLDIPEVGCSVRNIALTDWSRLLNRKDHSGKGLYRNSFDIKLQECPAGGPELRYILDLGSVYEVVSCRINGHSAGTLFWKPYRFDITDGIRNGGNEIELEVMNSIDCKLNKDRPCLHSGLLGPVVIRKIGEVVI